MSMIILTVLRIQVGEVKKRYVICIHFLLLRLIIIIIQLNKIVLLYLFYLQKTTFYYLCARYYTQCSVILEIPITNVPTCKTLSLSLYFITNPSSIKFYTYIYNIRPYITYLCGWCDSSKTIGNDNLS